jgi:hypothetical protein
MDSHGAIHFYMRNIFIKPSQSLFSCIALNVNNDEEKCKTETAEAPSVRVSSSIIRDQ